MTKQTQAQYADQTFTPLERSAIAWLDGFYSLEHLLATRNWAIRLAGMASPALKFAALVHDAERFFPGGPSSMPSNGFDNPDYLFAHSTRSADIVEEWLKGEESERPEGFDRRVRALIQRHEIGGNHEEDILQAADSLSFLQVFDWLVVHWVRAGHYTIPEVQEKLDWTVARIRVPAAVRAALPIYTKTTRQLQAAHDDALDVADRRTYASSALRLAGVESQRRRSFGTQRAMEAKR
ncbi:MAG: hypothetical protein P4M05_21315 [Bradyrhizobium sp.]|nr:hypothetical protein [Bradyrhizobium sp.]